MQTNRRNQLPAWAAPLIDRLIAAIVTALVGMLVGAITAQKHSDKIIKKLDADIVNLEAGVEYFRK